MIAIFIKFLLKVMNLIYSFLIKFELFSSHHPLHITIFCELSCFFWHFQSNKYNQIESSEFKQWWIVPNGSADT